MILHWYFARRFLTSWVKVLMVFYLFSLMVELANQLRWHTEFTDFSTLVYLAILNSTEIIYTIMPLIMIFASIWLFMSLARSSELVVARASGRSGLVFFIRTCCCKYSSIRTHTFTTESNCRVYNNSLPHLKPRIEKPR